MKNPIQSMAKFAIMLLVASISVVSCKKKTEAPAPVENEDITTVLLTFKRPSSPSDSVVYRAFFSKGYSQAATTPPAFSITSTKTALTAGVAYNASVRLFNALVTPIEDVTVGILANTPAGSEEGNANHQIYYGFNSAFASLAYADADQNGKPLGVKTTVITSATATTTGNLNVKLIHLPNKAANIPATPYTYTASSIGGSADIDVTFNNIVVQ